MDAEFFETLYARDGDPWQFEGSWYEKRKRALLLASLPQARYACAYEPACATGLLTAELAPRCDVLLASDGAPSAVEATRQRLKAQPHVQVRQAWLPEGWPPQRFDLIVLSEFLYYVDAARQRAIARAARASLQPGGTVAACHWRHPIEGCATDGDAVHTALHVALGLPRMLQVTDGDFRLDVWSHADSAAQAEARLGR